MMARRNELSTRNPWYLPRHRFLELKHYCLQVPDWEKRIHELKLSIGPSGPKTFGSVTPTPTYPGIPHEKEIIECDQLQRKINLIIFSSNLMTQAPYAEALRAAVTKGETFEFLSQKYDLAISRDHWYKNYYRKFFWVLDKELRKEERE